MAKVATRTSLPLPGRKVTYVCHNCGQSWEELVLPGRSGTYAVVKAGVDPAPLPKAAVSKPRPYLHSRWFSR
ncbi:MAG: hypothetical protein ACRDFT_09400, partial [bacterium]